jgi:ribonuclease J
MPADHDLSLTFFNGTRTVGGVQVLARAGRSGLCFDFGATPNPTASLFSRGCPPPRTGSLPAHLRSGMAPLIEGLYDPAQLGTAGRSVAEVAEPMRRDGRLLEGMPLIDDVEHLGVFVSHIHNDHCGLLPFVAPGVPVVMSAAGAALHAGMVDSGELPASPAKVLTLEDGGHTRVGDELDLQLLDVDHDLPGAAGFVLSAGDQRVAWTGDWRAHGHAPTRMARFAERAAGVDLLLTEGTTLAPDASPVRQISESELIDRVGRLLARTEGLAFVTPYPRNLFRLDALREVAAANGRTLVLSHATMAGWRDAARHGLTAPDPDARPVAVFDDPAAGGEGPGLRVGVDELSRDRDAFLVELQLEQRWMALAVGAGPGDLLVHCNGNPLGPWDPEWVSLTAWVRTLGLDFAWLNSGGHATPDDLAWLVDAVRPRAVVAVHSSHPELFPRTAGVPLVLPERGHSFPIAAPRPFARGVLGADPTRTVVACASS